MKLPMSDDQEITQFAIWGFKINLPDNLPIRIVALNTVGLSA